MISILFNIGKRLDFPRITIYAVHSLIYTWVSIDVGLAPDVAYSLASTLLIGNK